ncbi:MAG TPA: class I SAM-dependent rRNA methyltransferase [Verrucomicrobiota bacterium]|nr:rRNA large subunit methyltransferase I [Verrucomicrobiales bacterium]HRI12413.1 class I SAM-dependent rRNA methyltransferase [Verrucomicrobiota bacterium]
MTLATLLLKPGEADRLVAGHPWVYANSILRTTRAVADGELVQVKDHRQRLIGSGFYNSHSKILVRLLDRERIEPDRAFFRERLSAALAHRKRWLPGVTSFRVVNAESDFLSGLIVDQYEDVLVVQFTALGMDQRKSIIVDVLHELIAPRAILERSITTHRRLDEGLPNVQGTLAGESVTSVSVKLNGLSFETDLEAGHKTGLYLDQQTNYAAVAELARNANEVLDCFSFLGGFAIHAAKAGAKRVLALDQSAEAVAAATRNAVANGVGDRVTCETTNVFDWLKAKTTVGPNEKLIPRYDLIILDPPSFTRTRAAVGDALRGYKEIHLRALKLLKPGGVLATFCCSHHVDRVLFEDVVLAAATDTRHTLRRVASYSQSPDHPIIPAIPETEYLKGFAYELVR